MINKAIILLFLCLLAIGSNGVLADACVEGDQECAKNKAMEENSIKPLATKEPEKTPIINTKEINSGPGSFELPSPSANQNAVINPGLDFAPVNQNQETTKAINEASRMTSSEPKRKINTTLGSNLYIPQSSAPELKPLKPLSVPDIKPVGGNVAAASPSPQPAPSIYI